MSSESFVNEILPPLFTNTLLQALGSVVHAPVRSAPSASAPSDKWQSNNESTERRHVIYVHQAQLRLTHRIASRERDTNQAKSLADSASHRCSQRSSGMSGQSPLVRTAAVACRLYPRLRKYRCDAVKRRSGQKLTTAVCSKGGYARLSYLLGSISPVIRRAAGLRNSVRPPQDR